MSGLLQQLPLDTQDAPVDIHLSGRVVWLIDLLLRYGDMGSWQNRVSLCYYHYSCLILTIESIVSPCDTIHV
eukprot:jgi/Botrbrau1/22781/Bobra.0132s0107.1